MAVSERVTDKERLDWLEGHADTLKMDLYGKWMVRAADDNGNVIVTVRDDFRAAIDAAIRASRAKSAKEGE